MRQDCAIHRDSDCLCVSAAIQPAAEGLHLPGPVRAQPAAEDPGVLLRQHPLHEGLSEDRGAALQRWAWPPTTSPSRGPVHSSLRASMTLFVSVVAADVLSEEAILKWYTDAHVAKGKSIFLEQMKKFVEWLKNAEEGETITHVGLFIYLFKR